MSNIRMYYNNQLITPTPQIKYDHVIDYSNDLVVSYHYEITLDGVAIMPEGVVNGPDNYMDKVVYIKNLFASNGGTLKISRLLNNGEIDLLYASEILVKNISFNENNNSWSKSVNYVITLHANHLSFGNDLANNEFVYAEGGGENLNLTAGLHSPNIVNITNHKIKSFSEDFSLDTGENQVARTSIFNNFNFVTNSLGGEYFTISYNLSAIGKHDITYDGLNKTTLPAWEHAKRYVHTRLLQQMGGLFQNFLKMNGDTTRLNLHNNFTSANGAFSNFIGFFNYNLFNENISFEVSESEGSFSVTYNAIVKSTCPVDTSDALGCKDNVLHTFSKSITKSFNANEQTNTVNQETEITINGTITGLVLGGILNTGSKLGINPNLNNGSFIAFNSNAIDKNAAADAAFADIFNPFIFDFNPFFKALVGITPEALVVSPSSNLKPSNIVITRNFLEGVINYTATYNNKFNCDPNNLEVQLSVKEPIPLIAEFTIPNNNYKNNLGKVCPEGKGYSVIQLLGTKTPKEIEVTINGNVSLDFNRCCLGTTNNWNLFDYDFLKLESFIIPKGVNIPEISDSYILTKKTKSITYPEGKLSISLSYICSTVCEIDDYFKDIPKALNVVKK